VIASAVYVVLMLWYSWWNLSAMLDLKPQDFATFLSGVFAPLAFLWLVLGFRQQGDELKNSADALWLQGEELRNSVEQQRQLVEVSREQLDAEKAARLRDEEEQERALQPNLIVATAGWTKSGDTAEFRFDLRNAGSLCSNIRLMHGEEFIAHIPMLPADDKARFSVRCQNVEEVSGLSLVVHFDDMRDRQWEARYDFPLTRVAGDEQSLGQAQRSMRKL
jgi:hypothetical protein